MSPNQSIEDIAYKCLNGTQVQLNSVSIAVYALVFTAGLILNLIALVVFFRYTRARSHTTVYMTNLTLADLILVTTLPLRISYHSGFSELSQGLCEATGVVLLINMYGSIFLLTCISFDRCLAVCFPLSSRVQEGRKRAPLVCLGVWFLTVGASLPNYILVKGRESRKNCFMSFPLYTTQKNAVALTLTVGFGIPLAIMVLSSWGLLRAISRSTAAQTADLVDSRKIQRMIVISLVVFLVCFLPYHLTLGLMYLYSGNPEIFPCALVITYHYSLMVACLNAMLDPLVYYFTTETFRREVDMDAVRRMWPMGSHSSDGNNRSQAPLNS
ncbi:lysophosphatidic acid receptor 6 [Chanos chanos]|uniref:Lysophosphatidic acid receptor 6 n=1 Tax=Chanos chanos TaxID=29144 RepID=A0A6J2VV56_CHACN|nr:lysophosphatidic acid receptor 6-like [Chanos chanos]